jgi:hypothetical protein
MTKAGVVLATKNLAVLFSLWIVDPNNCRISRDGQIVFAQYVHF